MTILADLRALRGHTAEANELYEQAEDVIEGMLISVDEPYWNSSVAASMSEAYLKHFRLVARTGEPSAAFHVLERVRGLRRLRDISILRGCARRDRQRFVCVRSGHAQQYRLLWLRRRDKGAMDLLHKRWQRSGNDIEYRIQEKGGNLCRKLRQ